MRPARRHARRVRADGRAGRARGDGRRAARRGATGRERAAAGGRAGRRIHRDRRPCSNGRATTPPASRPKASTRCEGAEQWLALSIETDAEWTALVDVLGRPAWALDPSLASYAGRAAAQDRLDAELAAWAATRELAATVELLIARGVPAAAVADPRSISTNPQVQARGLYEESTHPVAGTHLIATMPFRGRGSTGGSTRPRRRWASTTPRCCASSASPTTRSPSSRPTPSSATASRASRGERSEPWSGPAPKAPRAGS